MTPPTPYRTLVGKIVSGYDDRGLKSELALLKHTLNEAVRPVLAYTRNYCMY